MSSIGTNSEDLVLNADGGSSEIKLKIDGTEKASISSAGAFTSTTIDATKLTGALPAISGANLTGVGVDGISSSADATAITIDSSEKVNFNQGRLQLGHANKFIDTANYVGDMINIAYHPYSAGINLGKSYPADNPTTVVKGLEVHNERIVLYYTGSSNSPTEKVRVDTDGLKFNGDTAAANALDDYEEGTFTPALSGNSTAGNTAYASQVGFYEKIGRTVHIRGSIEVSSKGTIDGLVFVTGLPFTANATTNRSCIHLGYADHFSITASESISGTVMQNNTTFLLRVWGDTGGTVNMDDARLSDSSDFYFSGTYYV